jgi:hypothetical protein
MNAGQNDYDNNGQQSNMQLRYVRRLAKTIVVSIINVMHSKLASILTMDG